MQLQALPAELPIEVRQWAEALRKLAEATGEQTAAALAEKLHCAPASLSRYLQGQRPEAAFSTVVSTLVELANKRSQQKWTVEELRTLCERSTQQPVKNPTDVPKKPPAAKSAVTDRQPEQKPRTEATAYDGEPAEFSSQQATAPSMVVTPAKLPQATGQELNRPYTDGPQLQLRNRKATLIIVAFTTMLCVWVGTYWLWNKSDFTQTPTLIASATAKSEVPAEPHPRCARVTAPASPVWVNLNDAEPLKMKSQHDQVRLLDLPPNHTSRGTFQAVAVPKGSPTGYGWMPALDLTPTPCASQPSQR